MASATARFLGKDRRDDIEREDALVPKRNSKLVGMGRGTPKIFIFMPASELAVLSVERIEEVEECI